MNSIESVKRNRSAEAAGAIIGKLQKKIPTDRGIPLSPRKLDEAERKKLVRRGKEINGVVTHREDITDPDAAQRVQQLRFEESDPISEQTQQWRVFVVAPEDINQPVVHIWRSQYDPGHIDWACSGKSVLNTIRRQKRTH